VVFLVEMASNKEYYVVVLEALASVISSVQGIGGMSQKSPRYLDVASKIEAMIDVLGPNAMLPTEQQFAGRFDVSRVTVRTALDLLERGGRVTRYRGRGTVVSPPKINRRFSPLYSFERDMTEQGIAFETRLLGFKPMIAPPEDIRINLNLPADSDVGEISLVRIVNHQIVSYERRHYPPEVSAQLTPELLENHDASTVVSKICGGPIDEVDWVSEIITSSKEVAAALEVAQRTLVFANTYTWRLQGGEPIESGTISYRIDRCRFKHEARFNQPKI
jgi:GntR family transcriptional regulator